MKDLFNLNVKDCVELVKLNEIDMIYSNAQIEGIAATIENKKITGGDNYDRCNGEYSYKKKY